MAKNSIPDPADLADVCGRRWWREKYTARDSIVHHPDGSIERERGGWDHEHCLLCMEVISAKDPARRFGYRDEGDEWLCEDCYCRHVKQVRA